MLLYAVLITKLKIYHYIDSHPIIIVSPNALGDIINNRESSGRIAKWGLELMDLNISVEYMARGNFATRMLNPCLLG